MAWIRNILRLILPGECKLCGDPASNFTRLCDACAGALPRNLVCCPSCANPTATASHCGECLGKLPSFDNAIAPYLYSESTQALIASAKFAADLSAVVTLGELLGRHLDHTVNVIPDCMVPVPLHPSRLRARGYNQALEMARIIRKHVPIPIANNFCRRVRPTAAQSTLSHPTLRRRNIRGAFAAGKLPPLLRHVALVDDVMTTGSTLRELASCLSRAGVARIDVWVFARATSR